MHYSVRQSSEQNVFDVNMTSGEIYSALHVDYEKVKFHWLIVQAVDSSLEDPQATNINVSVSVASELLYDCSVLLYDCSVLLYHFSVLL